MSLLLLFNQPSAVPAFLRVDADNANIDNWVDQAGSSTNIFNAIDEVSVDDADYILSPFEAAGYVSNTVRFRLSDPAPGKTLVGPVKIRYRFRKTDTSDKLLLVTLKQGVTTVMSASHMGAGLTQSFQTAEWTLTAPQLATITDFSNLFIEFADYEI